MPVTRMQTLTMYSPRMTSRNASPNFSATGMLPLRSPLASLTMTVHSSPDPLMGVR